MLSRADRKRALREFLRARRAAILPEERGLEQRHGRGRRAPGLTQAHMDQLLGCPLTGTYARLETGRTDRPEAWLLRGVAEVLRCNEGEWRTLWALALGDEPPHALDHRVPTALLASWQRVLDDVDCMAYITDGSWNLLAHNQAFAEMFESGVPPANTMRYMVLTEEARRTLADWERCWAPPVLAQLRAAAAAHPRDPTLERLVAEVRADPAAGPVFTGDTRAMVNPDGNTRPFRHPRLGPGRAELNAALLGGSPEARLIFVRFVPGD
ncbi:XRE family transcriptional regulator [Streptomyces sp. JJ36]|uniref:MmyB family transcriptional regulator n=1 Tax=Streptomyces sp. JJ36 TaxID=2736645 RepID=UPI001F1E5E7F|nr:XRE family transcriptional regulator [Streptomyces sp. JJ36]MCF6521841.1 XRE family transcriptional regulator [Streptomyces sp. JJ36]